ncbi:hypothetical protein [Aphanothece sacrum]|nr:hypothetical protein [Aphanothece sacrum]
MSDLIPYVPTIASTIIALGVLFGGLFWMIRLVIKVELIPLNSELLEIKGNINVEVANIRNEIKDSENRLEQRLTRLETLIEGIRDKK